MTTTHIIQIGLDTAARQKAIEEEYRKLIQENREYEGLDYAAVQAKIDAYQQEMQELKKVGKKYIHRGLALDIGSTILVGGLAAATGALGLGVGAAIGICMGLYLVGQAFAIHQYLKGASYADTREKLNKKVYTATAIADSLQQLATFRNDLPAIPPVAAETKPEHFTATEINISDSQPQPATGNCFSRFFARLFHHNQTPSQPRNAPEQPLVPGYNP